MKLQEQQIKILSSQLQQVKKQNKKEITTEKKKSEKQSRNLKACKDKISYLNNEVDG